MNIVLQSFKYYELTSLHPFIFAFILHSIGTILSKKCSEKWGVGKKDTKRGLSDRGEKRLGSNLLHNMGQPEGSYEVESVRCFLLSVSPGFLGIGSLAFSKFWHGIRNPYEAEEG